MPSLLSPLSFAEKLKSVNTINLTFFIQINFGIYVVYTIDY